jgi:hypothetical protein
MLLKAAESRIELITQGDSRRVWRLDGCRQRLCRTTARVRKKVFL